jgi:hypothetical protein
MISKKNVLEYLFYLSGIMQAGRQARAAVTTTPELALLLLASTPQCEPVRDTCQRSESKLQFGTPADAMSGIKEMRASDLRSDDGCGRSRRRHRRGAMARPRACRRQNPSLRLCRRVRLAAMDNSYAAPSLQDQYSLV